MSIKSFLLLTLIVLCYSVLTLPVSAQTLPSFTKYQANPLPFHPQFADRTETGTYQPSVLYENGIFKLWYASLAADGFKLAYADSTDGINWTNYKVLPVNPGAASHNPSILHMNNNYELYYTSDTGGLIVTKVTDDTSTRTVMVPEDPWESKGIFAPYVHELNGQYGMLYTGWGNQGFRLGMATSTDGNIWHKCPNNPILPFTADGAHLYKKDGISYLFFHSENGIEYVTTPSEPRCDSVWDNRTVALTKGPGEYDNAGMISPSIVEKDGTIYIYYSGLGNAGWTLNLANSSFINEIPPPSATKEPVVLIPGLFASWNRDALLHDATVPDDQWIMTPFVHEYDGLIKTLEANGYVKDTDFYIFSYDWRKPLNAITSDFNTYMMNRVLSQHADQKVHLIGHSLGGLVGRSYIQHYQPHLNGTLVTVGSPHKGVASTYKAAEGGEIETQNTYEWLAEKFILELHRGMSLTDREILQRYMPIVTDLTPVNPYIKKNNGTYIPVNEMSLRNSTLANLNTLISPLIKTIGSDSYQTVAGYNVVPRTYLDNILALYPDGRPVSPFFESGDGLIPLKSAEISTAMDRLKGNHGDIISSVDSLKQIFLTSQIMIPDSTIVRGTSSSVFPSLIGVILSPATLQIQSPTTIYNEENGVIFIPSPQKGAYKIKAIGTSQGEYTVLLGNLLSDQQTWRKISGKTIPGQLDQYHYIYDPVNPYADESSHSSLSIKQILTPWLSTHKRTIKEIYYTKTNHLLDELLDHIKLSDLYDLLPYLEQIELSLQPEHRISDKNVCKKYREELKMDVDRIMPTQIKARTDQKMRALILVWVSKRMEIIDRIMLTNAGIANQMIETSRKVINAIR